MAIRNARLYEEARGKEELRRELLEKVILAQEEERKRVARELHDEVGQALTALIMSLGSAEQALPPRLGALKERLSELTTVTAETLEEIRRLILDLRPSLLDDLGLLPAIGWYAENYLTKAGVEVELKATNMDKRLPPQVEITLFRILQEAITNIVKHSEAKRTRISLDLRDSVVHAVVEDDGKGFDMEQVKGLGRLGLVGVQERVSLLEGSFNIHSSPGEGTKLEVAIPVAET
jgi:signal transduction histidine kinase